MEFYTKAFFVALTALVAYGMLLVLTPFAGSMAWAIFLAFMLFPLHRWMTRKLGGRAGTSAGIIPSWRTKASGHPYQRRRDGSHASQFDNVASRSA